MSRGLVDGIGVVRLAVRILAVVWLASLGACQIDPSLERCGDQLCAPTAVCVDDRVCVPADEARACQGLPELAPCATANVAAGICHASACVTPGCGNGAVEPGEMCDDGNVILGDGCSADCRSNEHCGNGVLDFAEECDDGGFVSGDGCSSTCRNERLTLVTIDRPGPRFSGGSALVYAAAEQRLVYFSNGETWFYDTAGWRRGPDGPGPRFHAAMAYDAHRQKVVLHGGSTVAGTTLGDTWELDGTAWTQVMTAGGPGRYAASIAYDPVRQRVVLFGGTDSFGDHNSTWTFDGTTWTQLFPTGTLPSPRSFASMVFDDSRQALVLVGADMWQLGPTAWTQLSTTVPTAWGTLAYDAARMRLVLYANGAVWETQTTTWTARTDTPSLAGSFAIAYDAGRARVVLVGGSDEHWEVAASWTQNTFRPGDLPFAHAVFDTAGRRLLLRGGAIVCETWARDLDGTWTLVSPRDVAQPSRDAAIVYDPIRRRTFAFGDNGTAMETWLLDGNTWTKLTPSGNPPRRIQHALAFDREHDRIVMFGGVDPTTGTLLDDTWVFTGNTWSELAVPSRPEARAAPPLAYDGVRQRVVLAGGLLNEITPNSDCYELDGDQWLEIEPLPIRRGNAVLVYDESRGRSALVGGWTSIGVASEILELDGTGWTYAFPAPAPAISATTDAYRDVTYDPFAHALVAIGATGAADTFALGYFAWTSGEPVESCSGMDDLDGDALRGCDDPDCYAYCDPTCPPGASCAAERPRCGDGICDPALETRARCAKDCP